MTDESPAAPLSADAPIPDAAADEFGRDRLARRIAVEARTASPDGGLVLALCGPWGSGKTSIGNMVAEAVESDGDLWMAFNPWMFTGADDLVGRFFGELASMLGRRDGRYKAVAQSLGRYAGALSKVAKFVPVAGDPAAAVLESAERMAAGMGEGTTLDQRRRTLVEALKETDGRIVVFLDDLDRLTDPEIREIVRLVKLVGDLPCITYILSFDRERVEEALGAPVPDPALARERGRVYLEKIVQSRHDVPPLREQTLLNFMATQVDAAIAPYSVRFEPESDWTNMVVLGVRRLLRTPRDARRIANAIPAAIELYGDEVALVDLFGLEVLRVLEPDVHAALPSISEILVDGRMTFGDTTAEDQARLDAVLQRAREPEAVRTLLGQLFPHPHQLLPVRGHRDAQTERLAKRVATPAILRAYLHLALDDDTLPSPEIERLAAALSDPVSFAATLGNLADPALPDVITRLLDHRERFAPDQAVDIAAALMEVRERLPPDASPFLTGHFRRLIS